MPDDHGLDAVAEAYSQRRNYPGEAIDIELPNTLNELLRLKGEVDAVAAAAREVSGLVARHVISYLGDQGYAKPGPTFYRVQAKNTIKIKPEAQSRFWDWVRAHDFAPRLFNPNLARTTGLRELAEMPDPETGELMDRKDWNKIFLEEIRASDDLKLEEIPESKQAKWQQRLPYGAVQRGGPVEKGDSDGENLGDEGGT